MIPQSRFVDTSLDFVKLSRVVQGFRSAIVTSDLSLSSRDARPVHKAADAHYKAMLLAVSAAFMRGKKAYRSGGVSAAVKAIRASIESTLPSVLAKVYAAGGNVAIEKLPKRRAAEMRTLKTPPKPIGPFKLVFNATDKRAVAWAKAHAAELAKGLSESAEERIRNAIAAGLEGEDYYDEILDAVGSPERADVIARTEIMKAANEGNRAGWSEAIDAGLISGDERVAWIATSGACSECEALDGTTRALDEDDYDGDPPPPLHPNCLLGGSRVLPGSLVTATSKRWFDGDVVIIRVAENRELTCTPNHPILTLRGWVAAGLLNIGDDVVCDGRSEWSVDHQQMPSSIQDVTDAFLQSPGISTTTAPTSDEDFHGDGAGSEVAIIRTDRKLRNSRQVPFTKQIRHDAFIVSQAAGDLLGDCAETQLVEVGLSSTARSVRGSNLGSSLSVSHTRPLQSLGFGLIAEHDSVFDQPSTDERATSIQLACELIDGRACKVFTDKVVFVDRFLFHGLVYNLETEDGWFAANSIITHNCRCTEGLVS